MYGEKVSDYDYTTAMLVLLGNLHDQAFLGYVLDPAQVLEQAQAQLRGNDLAVRNYYPIALRFPSLTGRTARWLSGWESWSRNRATPWGYGPRIWRSMPKSRAF